MSLSNDSLDSQKCLNNEFHFSVSCMFHVVCLISFICFASTISSTKECVMLSPGCGISHAKKTTNDIFVDSKCIRMWRSYSKRCTSPLLS
jgi:hypothetical protein